MGAEKLIEKILSDANEKARVIIDEAKSEASKLLNEASIAAQNRKSEILASDDDEAELTKKRILASAHMEAKQKLLKAKQDLIGEAFNIALTKIRSMSDADFEKLMQTIMISMIETGDESVIINSDDKKRLSGDFLKKINDGAEKKGALGRVVMSEEVRDIPSGFILKRGGVEINATFEALLRHNRDTLSAEVVKILF